MKHPDEIEKETLIARASDVVDAFEANSRERAALDRTEGVVRNVREENTRRALAHAVEDLRRVLGKL